MPDPTPTIPTDDAARGIADVIDGFVAQNVEVDEQPIRQEYPDQDGAIAAGKEYDVRINLTCSVYTAGEDRETKPFSGGFRFDFRGKRWVLDNCRRADAYNDTVKWNVTAHRHEKRGANGTVVRSYPAASANSSGTGT